MDKRSFLKLLSAAGATPASAWMAGEKLSNWAGNLNYGTDRLHEVNTVEQVRAQVRAQPRMKVLGTRHCFNSIADSKHSLLSLKPMHEVFSIDSAARTVTVDAGITYGQLGPYLDGKGYALHNLASLPHISIAGACSTGTHGSGEKNGNLATAVSALELVTASGDVVKLSRKADGDTFRGAVVGLGALGVITRLSLDIQPTFQVRQYVYENLPLAQMRDHFDAIQASGYSVSLFTDWQKQRINELWIKSRVGDGAPFTAPPEFYGASRAARNLHPIAELSAENCTQQMGAPGPWYDRLPHFRMGFTPSAGKELQSEFFVPRRNAVDAILAIERLRDQVTPHLLISEIRTIAEDDLWMSASYRRPSVAIHFTWKPDWPAVRRLLPVIEKELGAFQYRPHWGKLFSMRPADLRSRYEKLPDFLKLAARFDPKGKFRNDFLNTNLFGQ
ncbi:FAD-binding protein [uncultured Paludibaculum sp.]|uniref:FAD-binding protein n=1 Tax=uncultured Paludibaculum sp. TaxID=1765020 RepID=UPI002AABA7D1|nr:FAD-binding protein [uncultured Paludibaculum sp.]